LKERATCDAEKISQLRQEHKEAALRYEGLLQQTCKLQQILEGLEAKEAERDHQLAERDLDIQASYKRFTRDQASQVDNLSVVLREEEDAAQMAKSHMMLEHKELRERAVFEITELQADKEHVQGLLAHELNLEQAARSVADDECRANLMLNAKHSKAIDHQEISSQEKQHLQQVAKSLATRVEEMQEVQDELTRSLEC